MKAEAFRDDLAARAYGPPTYFSDHPGADYVPVGDGLWSLTHAAFARNQNAHLAAQAKAEGKFGYIAAGATNLAARAFAGTAAWVDDKVARFEKLALCEGQSLELLMHRGGCGCHFPNAHPPCWRCAAPITFAEADELGWLDDEPETINFAGQFDALADMIPAHSGIYADYANYIRGADLPGIAAMAAKAVQPTPEPVLSVLGQQVSESELAQALQLVRAKNASPVKETPRGLMTVAPMDHRLGRWNEA